MSESKHTPGPWSVPHFAEPDTNCMCGYVLTGDMFGAVCTVHASGEGDDWQSHGDNPKFAEAVANAHLIAAAPDLLEALRDCLDRFVEAFPAASEYEPIKRGFAAIAKATASHLPTQEG